MCWAPQLRLDVTTGALKVANANQMIREPVQSVLNGVPRYSPVNHYNALRVGPPEERSSNYLFSSTYREAPFPIRKGTCAYKESRRPAEMAKDKSKIVLMLDSYRKIRLDMGFRANGDFESFLQPHMRRLHVPRRQNDKRTISQRSGFGCRKDQFRRGMPVSYFQQKLPFRQSLQRMKNSEKQENSLMKLLQQFVLSSGWVAHQSLKINKNNFSSLKAAESNEKLQSSIIGYKKRLFTR